MSILILARRWRLLQYMVYLSPKSKNRESSKSYSVCYLRVPSAALPFFRNKSLTLETTLGRLSKIYSEFSSLINLQKFSSSTTLNE